MGKVLITVLSNAVGGVVIERGFPDAVDRKLFEQALAQELDEAAGEALELVSSVLDVRLNADKVFAHKGSLKVGDVEALLAGARNVKASTKEVRDGRGLVAGPNPVEGGGLGFSLDDLGKIASEVSLTGRKVLREQRDAMVLKLHESGLSVQDIARSRFAGLSERNVRRIIRSARRVSDGSSE